LFDIVPSNDDKPEAVAPATLDLMEALPCRSLQADMGASGAAVFLLFSVIGPYVDLNLTEGQLPYVLTGDLRALVVRVLNVGGLVPR
jgi:hypothetical protein